MKIGSTFSPLAVCAVRDAVLYHERLLQSETLRNRADYEEYAVDLSVFLDEIKHRYKKIEANLKIPLDAFFDADVPTVAYRHTDGDIQNEEVSLDISDAYAPLLVSSVRDAILYRESLMQNHHPCDQGEYLAQLKELLTSVKHEYKKVESKVGISLEKILHSS
jgi:hypothetical protein